MLEAHSELELNLPTNNDKLSQFCLGLPSLQTSIPLQWMLHFPNISTIYSSLGNFEKVDHVYYKRLKVPQPDGGHNTLDFVQRTDVELNEDDYLKSGEDGLPPRTRAMTDQEVQELGDDESGVVVVLLHGLAGGSHESYVRATVTHLLRQVPPENNLKIAAFNARGCAGSKVTSSSYWNAMRSDDLSSAIQTIKAKFPKRRIMTVGFSLGANIMCHYLAKNHNQVDFAISVSNPWQLDASNTNLESWWLGRIYTQKMAAGLQNLFERHSEQLLKNEGVVKEEVMRAKSLREFDDAFTSRVFGFGNAKNYYEIASSRPQVPAIKTPLLIINAADDPMAPATCLPYEQVKANQNTAMVVSRFGGHIGWYGPGRSRWFANVVVDAVLGINQGAL